MKDTQLDKMSVRDLRELKARIDSAIVARQSKDRVELRQKMAELAEEAGLSLDDVLGSGRKGGRGKGSVGLYRHLEAALVKSVDKRRIELQ